MGTSDTSAASSNDEIASLRSLLAAKDARIAILEEQLRLATVKQFAPRSEKLSALAQMDLFNEAEAFATKPDAETQATEITVPAHARVRGKRKPIDATLPRVRIEHDIPEEEKTCACGCQLTRIGEVTSEQFDLIPARAQVLQHVRFKYACRSCEGTSHEGPAVVTAEMPAQPIPKSNASPGLLAHIATAKFADGMPLYRLEGILARDRIEVSRTTQASWMIRSGDMIVPLINLMQHAIAGLERGFAPEALLIIRKLYVIEKLARDGGMIPEHRHRLRNEKARPIWDELRVWLDANRHATPPQSLTGKAIGYLADEWPKLIRYLDDPTAS